MDRRSFLHLLGAVGVLTGAPTWLRDPRTVALLAPGIELPEDDDVSAWLEPSDLAVYGREKTFEFSANNFSELHAGIAEVQLKRLPEAGGATLLSFLLAPGGVVVWRATYPGAEIRGPIRIVVPEFIQAHVIGTDAQGRTVVASRNGVVPMLASA